MDYGVTYGVTEDAEGRDPDDMPVEKIIQELLSLDEHIDSLVSKRASFRKMLINRRNSMGEIVDQSDARYYNLTHRDEGEIAVSPPKLMGSKY